MVQEMPDGNGRQLRHDPEAPEILVRRGVEVGWPRWASRITTVAVAILVIENHR